MSIQTLQSRIQSLQKDIANLHSKLSDVTKKGASINERIGRIQKSIRPSLSASALSSKHRELVNLQSDLADVESKKAYLNKQIATASTRLSRYAKDLTDLQLRESKVSLQTQKRSEREQGKYQDALNQELQSLKTQLTTSGISPIGGNTMLDAKSYDFFISHASEDKEEFVRPLAESLRERGLEVWYDEFELKVGDSLRRKIDQGLVNSRFGVVVLSSAFFKKNWPQYELDGMVAREMNGVKVVLPIWHHVSKNDVLAYSPSLADKVALNSTLMTIDEIATELAELLLSEQTK